jgi:hypothetical protein
MRVSEEPVCIDLFRQNPNPVLNTLNLRSAFHGYLLWWLKSRISDLFLSYVLRSVLLKERIFNLYSVLSVIFVNCFWCTERNPERMANHRQSSFLFTYQMTKYPFIHLLFSSLVNLFREFYSSVPLKGDDSRSCLHQHDRPCHLHTFH